MPYVKAQLSVPQIEDANGNPASGYTISSYLWDTSTPTPMYTSSAGAGSATSFTLNSLGQPQSAGGTAVDIFLDTDVTYKFIVRDAGNQPVGPTIGPINASDGTASTITFLQSGAGAVEREANAKMGEIVSVKDFGAVGDGVTDDTAAITAALADNARVYFPVPSVSYLVSSINIPAGKVLETESVAVKFKQASGQPTGTRILQVMGSNVTIGDCTLEGNISTDSGEFNHGIGVETAWAGTSLSNITIGNIKGIDIRGDVVYIGQTIANGTTSNVRLSSADGNNIYRNVVSVVSGTDIEIGQVTGSAVGYMHVDIEPDSASTGHATNVSVKHVKGRHIGILSNSPSTSNVNQNIRFGVVDLDPSYATQSTPSYTPGASVLPRAVHLRNVKGAHIGSLKVNGFDGSAIWSVPGGVAIESVVIDQAIFTDCAKNDATYYSYVQCANVNFGYLYAATQAASINQRVIAGNNCVIQSGNITLGNNSSVVRGVTGCNVQNCVISGTGATGTYVAYAANGTRFVNCTVSNVERLAGAMDGLVLDGCTATLSIAALNSVTNAVYIRSTVQSQHYAFAAATRAYTNAMAFGSYFLWVDATGDLRISSGAPASDTDGTVVGTQS